MSIFGKTYADAYDALYRGKDYAAESDMVKALLAEYDQTADVETILDLGCGMGSCVIPLAQRGHRMSGVDLSAEMVERAAAKAAEAHVADRVSAAPAPR